MSEEKGRAAALTEVALIFAAIFWGLNFAATKYVADFVPQLFIVAFRFNLGGLLLLLILRLLEPESRLGREDILPMMGLGFFGIGAAQTAFTYGVSLTSAASTGLVFTTAPVWGMVLGFLSGLERPGWRGLLGVGLCILGVGIVFYGGLGSKDDSLVGDLVILLAAVSVGAYTVFSMPMLERHSPLTVATYPTLFGGPVVLLLSLPSLPSVAWGSMGFGQWAALGYSAVFATAFAFAAWQRGISRIGANRVLVYQYLITLTGVTSGIVFFGEDLGLEKILGGAVILLGVYLARRQ
ncbi:MAG: DMT family transporter [Actinobacteria bacterium]|nr:DMT family transporter [Actinomycetota bacterium]